VLLYGYATGIYSSRRLEKAAQELVPCHYLTAGASIAWRSTRASGHFP
jgi:transposase